MQQRTEGTARLAPNPQTIRREPGTADSLSIRDLDAFSHPPVTIGRTSWGTSFLSLDFFRASLLFDGRTKLIVYETRNFAMRLPRNGRHALFATRRRSYVERANVPIEIRVAGAVAPGVQPSDRGYRAWTAGPLR